MTTSVLAGTLAAAPADSIGAQRPRIRLVPPAPNGSSGREVAELAAQAGLVLDPWETYALEDALGEREDGSWASFEVGVDVGRQNGKGSILEARELGGLFLLGERLILHSAHQVKTAHEAFIRIVSLLENADHLRKQVRRINKAHGEEGVELKTGQRLRFIARSRVSGRGFSGDCIILDEAFELSDAGMAALFPTLAARPNPQVWYTSSSANQERHPHSRVLARLRRRALAGDPSRLTYLEWSLMERDEWEALDAVQRDRLRRDPESWRSTNPGYGIRISQEYVRSELGALSPKDFDIERLGIGDWPSDDADGWDVISRSAWDATCDVASQVAGAVAFAVDVTPDQSHAAIASAGARADFSTHVELVDHRPGTGWVAGRLAELRDRWSPIAVVVDAAGPAGALLVELEALGIDVTQPSTREVGQASAAFANAVVDGQLHHIGQAPLSAAVAGARKRPLTDAWTWARRGLNVDISPLVAVTLAAWGFATGAPAPAIWFFDDDEEVGDDE